MIFCGLRGEATRNGLKLDRRSGRIDGRSEEGKRFKNEEERIRKLKQGFLPIVMTVSIDLADDEGHFSDGIKKQRNYAN